MDSQVAAALMCRLDNLEARLGMLSEKFDQNGQQGDSIAENLVNAAAALQNSAASHEKLAEATRRATELNNYTDPNFVEKIQEREMQVSEIAAAEPIIRHHHECMQRCNQVAPVLESEVLTQVPKMQKAVDNMYSAAAEVKEQIDNVSSGVQELAGTCGAAASEASEKLAQVAQSVEQAEVKKFPSKRNGLD